MNTSPSLLERCKIELNGYFFDMEKRIALIKDIEAVIAEQQEPVEYQYKSNSDGNWYRFDGEKHYQNTKADGQWEIRALYTHPQAHHNIGVKT